MYLGAIVLANLTLLYFGPAWSIVNAFLFIGLDLTARDHLHDAWRGRGLLWKMALLIGAGSLISYAFNSAVAQIAIASFVAFSLAAIVDAVIYHFLGGYPRWMRINGSNVPSAAVDSIVFPTLAFGGFLPLITLGQFAAKVLGGAIWSVIFAGVEKWKLNHLTSTN
jgi:hypothetical protein